MDGILGIGRGTSSDSTSQLLSILSSTHAISSKLLGLHLSRATDGLSDGELNLGGVNKDRFTGEINYIDTITDTTTGFWEIPLNSAGVNGKSLDNLSDRTAIIDTGTSFILMPPSDALALHKQIPGYTQDGETFSVPCDTSAVIHFTFNKQSYNISTPDWRGGKLESGLCRSNVIGRQTFGDKQWLVGDVFLKNVYAVFDFEGGRVGFGTVADNGGQTSTSTSSVPGTKSQTLTAAVAAKTSGGLSLGAGGGAAATTAAAVGEGEVKKGGARKVGVAWGSVLGVVGAASWMMCILG
jgi:hypothetical protein